MDVQFTEEVIEIARKADRRFPSDIVKATDEAERKIRALPDFDEIVDTLVRSAVRELVYYARHVVTTRIKNETGARCTKAKVVVGKSNGVLRAAESCYNHRIAGTILGMVYGKDLADIAASEAAVGKGHLFNSALAAKLSEIVPAESMVQDAVPETKLRKIMKELQRKLRGGESSLEFVEANSVTLPLGEALGADERHAAKRIKQRAAALAKPR